MTTKQDQNAFSNFIQDASHTLSILKDFHQLQTDLNVEMGNGFSHIKDLFIAFGKDLEAIDKRLKRVELYLASHESSGHA